MAKASRSSNIEVPQSIVHLDASSFHSMGCNCSCEHSKSFLASKKVADFLSPKCSAKTLWGQKVKRTTCALVFQKDSSTEKLYVIEMPGQKPDVHDKVVKEKTL